MRNQSKITSRGRATLPNKIRKRLDVKVGDTLKHIIFEDGCVVIQKQNPDN